MYVPIMYAKIILVFIVNSYWFLVSKSEPPFFYYFFSIRRNFTEPMIVIYLNINERSRENRSGNQEWTIQRHRQNDAERR